MRSLGAGSGGAALSTESGRKYRVPAVAVYLIDLPGHGRSTGRGRTRIDAYVEFIEDFVAALHLERVILAGHSLGGGIALQAALRRPSWLAGLILVGTGARLRVHPDLLNGLRDRYPEAVDWICRQGFGPDASEALIQGSRQALLETDPDVTWGDFAACHAFDVMAEIQTLLCPALIVSGSDDRLTPPEYGLFLKNKIRNSRYRLIQRAGHMMALEKPRAFIDELATFLSDWPDIR